MNNLNSPPQTSDSTKSSHPIVFFVLYLPYGIFTGYLTVTLAYLFSRAGISIGQIAGLAAINLIPQIFKFLWTPIVDTSLSLKKWYIISTIVTSACLLATGIVPLRTSNLQFLTLMVIVSSFARSFIGASAAGLAAHDTPEKLKGRVGGYIQSGNLGGTAVGGGVGLWLAVHAPAAWMAAGALAFACVLCCAGLIFVKEPLSTIRAKSIKATVVNVVKDIWQTIKRKTGLLALILCLVPLGTGSAGFLFAAVAKDWRTGADTVALVTGIIGGMVTILGSLTGGWLCDLMNRQKAYILFGLLQTVSALAMAFFPHTPLMYITWTLLYIFSNGLNYAAFTAFALEAIGKGAAASKYELYASISFWPIYLMTWVAGAAYTKWGANGMLNTEACCALVGTALFICARALIKRKKGATSNTEPVLSPL